MSTAANIEFTYSADDAVPGKRLAVTGLGIIHLANWKAVEQYESQAKKKTNHVRAGETSASHPKS